MMCVLEYGIYPLSVFSFSFLSCGSLLYLLPSYPIYSPLFLSLLFLLSPLSYLDSVLICDIFFGFILSFSFHVRLRSVHSCMCMCDLYFCTCDDMSSRSIQSTSGGTEGLYLIYLGCACWRWCVI